MVSCCASSSAAAILKWSPALLPTVAGGNEAGIFADDVLGWRPSLALPVPIVMLLRSN